MCVYMYIYFWSSVYKYLINQWRDAWRSRSINSTQSRPERRSMRDDGWPALQVPFGGDAGGGPRRSWWRAAVTLVEAAAALEEGRGGGS